MRRKRQGVSLAYARKLQLALVEDVQRDRNTAQIDAHANDRTQEVYGFYGPRETILAPLRPKTQLLGPQHEGDGRAVRLRDGFGCGEVLAVIGESPAFGIHHRAAQLVEGADKGSHEGGFRGVVNLEGRADLLHDTPAHDHHAVG